MTVSPRDVAESYWSAKRARDIDAMTAHYHEDAEFTPAGHVLKGQAEIHAFHEDSVARYPGMECTIVHDITSGDEAAIVWEEVLIDRQGVRHPLVGVNIIRVKDGKFRSVRSFVPYAE